MRSKNHKALTTAERDHLERVKEMHCGLCQHEPPSSAHHIRQGDHWTVIPLCWHCHQGRDGWHGTKALWRVRKADELSVLSSTVRELLNAKAR